MAGQLLLGLALAALIAFAAYRRGSLSRSGAAGAILIGATVFGLGGWAWGILLVVFFVSSSALSHFKEGRKAALADKFSKGSQRDLWQTLANGGAGALCVIGNFVAPHPLWWAAYVGAIATVNADTWATELGTLSRSAPRLMTTGKPVEVGTSGGITVTGTLAALGGAALIAFIAALYVGVVEQLPLLALYLFLSSTAAGLLGSFIDSWLGATVQATYFCDACGKETERHPTHTCGSATRQVRGWRWLENDWVNGLSSVVGAALAAWLWWMLSR
ncbi:MAG: DUF92 domain-containing protein [Anaerolineales bacterium]